jgi:dipeptidyl aminopeptidase/acylaminoacyl peptidase
VSAALVTAACGTDSTAPSPLEATSSLIAAVEYVGTRAALFIDRSATSRTRLLFTGATDSIAGNSPLVPPVRDENFLALGPLSWSPDGQRLAFVATLAHDQSEVVVVGADGAGARVASPNTQIILSRPDWSPDGTKLLYAMSTLSHAQGVELFITNLTTNTVQQLTSDRRYRPLDGALRFGADGASILYARKVGETGGPLFEAMSEVWRADIATGAATKLADVTGAVQAIARSGAWALVLQRKAPSATGYDQRLVRIPLTGNLGSTTLVDGGDLHRAHLTSDDARAILVRNTSTDPGRTTLAFLTFPAAGGAASPIRGTGAATIVADTYFR